MWGVPRRRCAQLNENYVKLLPCRHESWCLRLRRVAEHKQLRAFHIAQYKCILNFKCIYLLFLTFACVCVYDYDDDAVTASKLASAPTAFLMSKCLFISEYLLYTCVFWRYQMFSQLTVDFVCFAFLRSLVPLYCWCCLYCFVCV